VPREKALDTIEELPPGLHPFYERILYQLNQGEPAVVKACIQLLKAMLLAYRPLKLEEITSVTGLSDDTLEIDTLIDRCASFVRKRGVDTEFVHQSARDYLGVIDAQSILDPYSCYGHGNITLNCLSYLAKQLEMNLVGLLRPNSTRESIRGLEDLKRNTKLASLDYAATFWPQHLRDGKESIQIQKALSKEGEVALFLQNTLLEWLECLSLLDNIPHVIEGLKVLRDNVKVSSISLTYSRSLTYVTRKTLFYGCLQMMPHVLCCDVKR
jgi:hypothetical protein